MPSPQDVAAAWHSVESRWFVRRNKANDEKHRYEVVVSDDDELEVIDAFAFEDDANAYRQSCEDWARGDAVLRMLEELKG
jgi:hypothetical protein